MNITPAWLQGVAYRLGQVRQQLGFVPPLSKEDKQELQSWLPASALSLFYTMSNADQQHSLRVCRGLQLQGCIERDMLAAALLHDVGKAQGRVPFWTRPAIVLGRLLAPRLLSRIIIPLKQIPVGTDVSRPACLSIAGEDVIHRSLQGALSKFLDVTIADKDAMNRSLPNIDGQRLQRRSVGAKIHCAQRWGRWGNRPRNASFGSVDPSQPILGRNEFSPLPTLNEPNTSVPAWRRSLSYAWWHAEIGADLAANAGLSERAVLYIRTHHNPHGPAANLHRVDEVS